MTDTTSLVSDLPCSPAPGQLLIVEAPAGRTRRAWVEQYLRETASAGSRAFHVDCDFELGGPWAGVSALLTPLLGQIEEQRPHLIQRHIYELMYVFPRLRRTHTVANPTLTDLAPPEEKVRNYPVDRAYRIVHGLIDLLHSWKTTVSPDEPWVLACDGLDLAGAMTRRFFSQLMRRRQERLRLSLVAVVDPGKAEEVRTLFQSSSVTGIHSLNIPVEPPVVIDAAEAARRAEALEEQIAGDAIERQVYLPQMVSLWRAAGRKDKELRYRAYGLDSNTTLGLYEDTLRYCEGLLDLASEQEAPDPQMRWMLIVKTLNCLIGLGKGEAGLKLAQGEGLRVAGNDHFRRGQLFYLIAMLYARYQQPRNLPKGEEYLDAGLAELEQSDAPKAEIHFQSVFNRNGLAMIRNFQGRHQEAIELCGSGIERLNTYLGAEKHRLHRSVLMYNMAQVYAATGSYDEALQYYSDAMEMDPGYSEYFNERGNVFLRMGRLEEARADYLHAIELSPPYFEVFTNLGQCYRRSGAMAEAIQCYSRALDLEPGQLLALLGRAKAHEELGHRDAAIADYTEAVALDPRQWEAIASRGVLYYERGDLRASLADFDRALELAPQQPGLHQNRAVVLADLSRSNEEEDANLQLTSDQQSAVAG